LLSLFKTIGDVCLGVIKLIALINELGVHEPVYISQPCIIIEPKHTIEKYQRV